MTISENEKDLKVLNTCKTLIWIYRDYLLYNLITFSSLFG